MTLADQQPWIEKYRPKGIHEVSAQEETIQVLRKTMESGNLPHLLFYGPPGTGKTSTILALARDIYGVEAMKTRVLELNASDERGIDIVREKVKNFARVTVSAGTGVNGKALPPFKLIILDEADSMTVDAQSALRRTMETYSKMTRFCLICNYVSRIIEPLASRCSKFRFKPLDNESIRARLDDICQKENVVCPPEVTTPRHPPPNAEPKLTPTRISNQTITTLITVSEGDLRKAIMYLQSAVRLCQGTPIPPNVIVEIAGVVPQAVIEDLWTAWVSKDFYRIQEVVGRVGREGYSGVQVVSQLHDRMIADVEVSGARKAVMAEAFGGVDRAMVEGSDEGLQVLKLLVC
ncbi:replication factor C subunit 4 [Podochytrium sp. JEL0797]|nr:replication factor C subunit 4 [Podochytrium sp. JEL0797]